jgi:hypothetical protein
VEARLPLALKAWPNLQLRNGAILSDPYNLKRGLAVPSSQLAIDWFQDKPEAAAQAAHFQMLTLDHLGLPMLGLWVQGKTFSYAQLLRQNATLFDLAFQATGEARFFEAAAVHKELCGEVDIPQIVPNQTIKIAHLAEEMGVGMIRFIRRDFSAAFALSGYNSGMGSFHKNHVGVVNFGPHRGPLDSLEGFGIDRRCHYKDGGFQDCQWDREVFGGIIRGWTQDFSTHSYFEASLMLSGEALIGRFFADENHPKFQFIFYIRAEEVRVRAQVIKKNSLQKYEGEPAKMVFNGGGDSFQIRVEGVNCVQVIPVGGNDCFFGADFLLVLSGLPTRVEIN